jgi:hypothetical protein
MVSVRGPGRVRARAERSGGQALVEFALVAPLLFLLILGTIEAGRFIFFQELLNNATREGARYAIVHGADSVCPSGPPAPGTATCDLTGENVKARVQDAALSVVGMGDLFLFDPVWTSRGDLSNPSAGDTSNGTNDRGEYVTVFLDFTYRPLVSEVVNVGVLPDITISAESTLVINY